MMKHRVLSMVSAVVTMSVLCLALLCLFPLAAQASGTDEPYSIGGSDSAASNVDEGYLDTQTNTQQLPEDASSQLPGKPTPNDSEGPEPGSQPSSLQEAGQEAEDEGSIPASASGATEGIEDGLNQGDLGASSLPFSETSGLEEPAVPEDEPEEPLIPDTAPLYKSSRTVAGYNVFEVDSFAALARALSTTSYPSPEYPETSVYILLTGDVQIEAGFMLHSSIEKVLIDGDGLYTLSETNRARSQVSSRTAEVKFKGLTIVGRQYFGLFDNIYSTDVLYIYEQVKYTGPQLLWAFNSTAHFYDCDINISTALDPAHEVAEIRDVYFFGSNIINHSSPIAVFLLYNSGNLTLSPDATLNINARGNNDYILFTQLAQSALRLEENATLKIEGSSRQLTWGAGLHSIHLGNRASFHWEANLSSYDYIVINSAGGAKDAIYLSEGSEFRVAPFGTASERLIRIDGGNVVVAPGASLSLRSILYTASNSNAPFHLAAASSLTVGESASFSMEIANSNDLSSGLLHFAGGAQSGFFVGKDATVVIRGNRAKGAVCFSGAGSRVEITDPNYLEIAVTLGFPIYFNNASVANPCTLTYTDVQQINYWGAGSSTYLNGGKYSRRWAVETGMFSVKAAITAGGNKGMLLELAGDPLAPYWTPALDATTFSMNDARILSVGRVGVDVSFGGNTYQGRITAPTMGIPYSQGAVQLRAGQPGTARAVSPVTSATPGFSVSPNQTVGPDDEISVWAEYGYVFHNSPSATAGGTLALMAPELIQFGTLPIPFADMEASAQGPYSLQVRDDRGTGNGWQVMASFGGFHNAEKALNSSLVLNNVPLGEAPQQIIASAGSETVPLEARLLVPGGDAEVGTYTGTVSWTLVDAP